MRKSENTTNDLEIDDSFYVFDLLLRVFSPSHLENPKKLTHEETTKSTLSSIHVFAFLHFGDQEANTRRGVHKRPYKMDL
jgi:hypothetical protein